MKTSEVMSRNFAIETNLMAYSPGIFLHPGVPFQCADGSGTGHTSKMVIAAAEGVSDDGLKKFIAAARRAGLEELKMVGASIIVFDSRYKKDHWKALRELKSEDGRILGMTIKVTGSEGALPTGADFIIIDPPDAADEESTGSAGVSRDHDDIGISGVDSSLFLNALKKYLKEGGLAIPQGIPKELIGY